MMAFQKEWLSRRQRMLPESGVHMYNPKGGNQAMCVLRTEFRVLRSDFRVLRTDLWPEKGVD